MLSSIYNLTILFSCFHVDQRTGGCVSLSHVNQNFSFLWSQLPVLLSSDSPSSEVNVGSCPGESVLRFPGVGVPALWTSLGAPARLASATVPLPPVLISVHPWALLGFFPFTFTMRPVESFCFAHMGTSMLAGDLSPPVCILWLVVTPCH